MRLDADVEQDSDSYCNDAGSRVHCNTVQSRDRQTAQAIRAKGRATVHEDEHVLVYR